MRNTLLIIGFVVAVLVLWGVISSKTRARSHQNGTIENQETKIADNLKNTQPNQTPEADIDLIQDIDNEAFTEAHIDADSTEDRLMAEMTANMSISKMQDFIRFRQNPKVRTFEGLLVAPYQEQKKCDDGISNQICRVIIQNATTGTIVWDGNWQSGYMETGIGQEVVFVQGK